MRRIQAMLAALLLLLGSLTIASPAQADDLSELFAGCNTTWPVQWWGLGTYYNGLPVGRTGGDQVGGSSSACEDINLEPVGQPFNYNTYARTYMCNSSGSCWYNAWRFMGTGRGVTATDMANGTFYHVEIASAGALGDANIRLYD